ncbi:UvrABC system protein C [Fundidesulfovibrio magnetotacticus]|uniref:UvrABC system protein C n=1 Tax=Fundidesulfovibrio magnetotacticus TaxID=2730080 RepID=A0A6V8LRZ3_9BACT|nr:excinuclease ABC subunit UvrC [Fundidesulfovibrio magnetotacticus]GFK94504.1 UvrABC system protein C [Fundidesulfovibrio magnetotacticus]
MFEFVPRDFPQDPGVYLMKNAQGKVLYVGKAVNLRSRLSSYFRADVPHPRTRAMVARVAGVDVLVTATEKEALLLEASLIKKHRPRYNVVLRDDKSHILFKLDKTQEFPKIAFTRRVVRDGSAYFGPFTSAGAARRTWKELGKLFPLRKCRDASFKNRVRPCLYHHIGQCLAPCAGNVSPQEYAALVRRVEAFLSGRSAEVIKRVEREMLEASEALQFERAADLRDLAAAMRATVEGQAAVLPNHADLDAVDVFTAPSGLGLCVLFVRQGRLLDRASFHWTDVDEAALPDILPSFLAQFYRPESFVPGRVLLSRRALEALGAAGLSLAAEVLTERREARCVLDGARNEAEERLLEIASANASRALSEARVQDGEGEGVPALLGRRLGLGREARRIETVDASHLGGKGMRVGMVVFEEGRFAKDDYRLFAFPELEGTGDDYAALSSWVARRIGLGEPWPDLVLVDGGRGQLAAVERAMAQAGLPRLWELASIAKSGRAKNAQEDQIFRPGRKNPVGLRPGSRELLFLQKLRDEAHRYVIGRQRQARKKAGLHSEVLGLPGVGPKTAKLLWDRFGDLERLLAATEQDLMGLDGFGPAKAQSVGEALAALRKARSRPA